MSTRVTLNQFSRFQCISNLRKLNIYKCFQGAFITTFNFAYSQFPNSIPHLIIPYGFFCLCHIPPKLNVGTSIPPIKSNIFLSSPHHFTNLLVNFHQVPRLLISTLTQILFFINNFHIVRFVHLLSHLDMLTSMSQCSSTQWNSLYLSLHCLNTPKIMVGLTFNIFELQNQSFCFQSSNNIYSLKHPFSNILPPYKQTYITICINIPINTYID